MKKLCPVCRTPQRYRRRKGFKIHQSGTGEYVTVPARTFPAVLNRDLEPTLRGPGGPDAVGIASYHIPAHEQEVYEFCWGSEFVFSGSVIRWG